ncbi:uncharacterized protein [Aegilops tauschii subsp. strangulata]|uniref:uncharacterized protein n=1 Tax=Aegilops tauschii subsp. strangulata TaxID=200361 RepID=UPI003CC88460
MQNLKVQSDLPWCVIGDFNEALWSFEHMSATPRSEPQMQAFRDVLETCNLVDLGFQGLPFTYDNKQRRNRNVKVRLDRAVADNNWRNLFSAAKVVHQVSPCSDHLPILLKCVADEEKVYRPSVRRYEIFWERDASLQERIANSWEEAGAKFNLGDVRAGLKSLLLNLHAWGKKRFGNVTRELEKSRTKLEELLNMNANRDEIKKVSDHMNELLYQEKMLWLQRSRIDWLKEGDRNIEFFHRKAVWRARKNKVRSLIDNNGVEHADHKAMGGLVQEYFQNIFSKDTSLNPTPVVNLFEPVVTDAMNVNLCAEFSEKEIADGLFQIGPLKAPGSDGLPARFFQRNWSIFKDEIVSAVRKFFQTGIMPEGVNEAIIVLIPKTDEPKREKKPDASFCAYKLDLSKAYDRVDWGFLERVMGVRTNAIEPLKICRGAPGVSHLLFADDTLLFFKANQQQAGAVQDIIHAYESATGQLINPAKCSILFG